MIRMHLIMGGYGRHVGHEVGMICCIYVYECSYTACLQSTITGSVDTCVDSMYSSGSFDYYVGS